MTDLSKRYKRITDLLEGRLTEEKRSLMGQQNVKDPALRRLIDFITALKDEARDIDWEQIQDSVHGLIERQLQQLKKTRGKSKRKQGIIVFDSQLLPLPQGVRPATVSARRLKFLIDDEALEMALYPISINSYEIIGQLPAAMVREGRTLDLRGRSEKYSCPVNDMGIFRFPRVSTGEYKMLIRGKRAIVAEVNLEI